jgi:hypothetical protein
MNLGEHLTATFNKAGIENDNPALIELIKKVATVEIQDELVTKFNTSYLTVEAAKNNPEIKKHFYAPALNGVDSEIKNLLTELELDDETKTLVEAEKSTYKRIPLLVKKVIELEAKKGSAKSGEKTELQTQINTLKQQIADKEKEKELAFKQKDSEYNEKLTGFVMQNELAGFKYASDLAKDENFLMPRTKIANELKDKKLRVSLVDNKLKLETEDGTDYYEGSTKVDFKSFTEKTLAHHKLLEISNQSQQTQAPKVIQTQQNPVKASGSAMYDQMIAEAQK